MFKIFLKHLEIKGIIHSTYKIYSLQNSFKLRVFEECFPLNELSENIMPQNVPKFKIVNNISVQSLFKSYDCIWRGKTLQFKLFIDNLTLKLAVNHWAWITDSMNSRINKTDSVTWINNSWNISSQTVWTIIMILCP